MKLISGKLISIALALLILSSCSTSWNELFESESPDQRNKKLMESFGAEEEVFEKFTENKELKNSELEKKEIEKAELEKPAHAEIESKNSMPGKTEPGKLAQTPKKQSADRPALKKTEIKKAAPKKPEAVLKENKIEKRPENKAVASSPKLPPKYPKEFISINKASEKNWADYTPRFFSGESMVLDINYMGISTGKIVLSTEEDTAIGNSSVYHVKARVKTSEYYSYLYELDDNVDSYISKEDLVPVKYSMIQRESGQDVDDLQLFERDDLRVHWFYQRVTEDKTKKKKREEFTPVRFTDPLYIVWFLRGMPMEEGSNFVIPIVNKGKLTELAATSQGIETLNTKLGEKQAYKIKATTTYTGETLKSGDMTFWFSADERRIFLKFEAKIKIGSISGEIEKYQQ